MANIDKTAIIGDNVKLSDNIEIGPYCVLRGNIAIGEGTKLKSHVYIEGNVAIGKNNTIFPFASIGTIPQDVKYKGEETSVKIGDGNMIREYVTINAGTETGGGVTKVGDNNMIMTACHIAHDCNVGNNVIMANGATLAGHVVIEDFVVIGGLSAVHQFIRIGSYAMIGGMSGIDSNVPPFVVVKGNRAFISGINVLGLRRHGFGRDDILNIKDYYQILLYDNKDEVIKQKSVNAAKMVKPSNNIERILEFYQISSKLPFCKISETSHMRSDSSNTSNTEEDGKI